MVLRNKAVVGLRHSRHRLGSMARNTRPRGIAGGTAGSTENLVDPTKPPVDRAEGTPQRVSQGPTATTQKGFF